MFSKGLRRMTWPLFLEKLLITIKRIYYEKDIYLNNYGLDADSNC